MGDWAACQSALDSYQAVHADRCGGRAHKQDKPWRC